MSQARLSESADFVRVNTADVEKELALLEQQLEEQSQSDSVLEEESFIQNVRKALSLIQSYSIDDFRQQAVFHDLLAQALFLKEEFSESLQHALECHHLLEGSRFYPLLLRNLNILARLYRKLGDNQRAIEFVEQLLMVCRQIGDESKEAEALFEYGVLCSRMEQHHEAIEFFLQALALFQKHRDTFQTIACCNHLCGDFVAVGETEKALHFGREALKIHQQSENSVGVAASLARLGEVYLKSGDAETALRFFGDALEKMPETSLSDRAEFRVLMSKAALLLEEYELAQDFLHDSLSLSSRLGLKEMESESLHLLSRVCEAREMYEQALEYLEKYAALEEELQENKSKVQLKNMEILFQTQEMERKLERERRVREEERLQYERMNAFKEEVAGMLSHDLKNPMAVIKSCTMLLEAEGFLVSEKAKEIASDIDHQVERMLRLVSDWLELSRLETGRIRKQWVVPETLMMQLYESQKKVAEEHGMSLELHLESLSQIELYCDSLLVWQATEHLLRNAFQHSQSTTPILLNAGVEEERYFFVEVDDHGVGIPFEARELVFERFYRLASSEEEEGTGLGLPIVKAIMELHDGKVLLKKHSPSGACFRLCFPFTS